MKIVRMIPGSTTANFYGVYMEIFKTMLGKKNSNFSIKCIMKFLVFSGL